MEKKKHILIVDDDKDIRDSLSSYLSKYQFIVTTARDGEEMQKVLGKHNIDLILLDLMIPGEDGFALLKKIRLTSSIPVIMLTGVGEETEKVIGLEIGADDYQTKPFNLRELLARIKAVLRRYSNISEIIREGKSGMRYEFLGWVLDTITRRFTNPEGKEIPLSSGEYELLMTFLERSQRVLNRDQLLDLTKHRHAEPFDRSVDVQISRLRKKIETDPKNPKILKTIRGGGYIFACSVNKISLGKD
jgi:two-component system OmpR family response regulator